MRDILTDLKDFNLPKDWEQAFKKVKCNLQQGGRIYWYYNDEKKFCESIGEEPRLMKYWSGITVIAPDREVRSMGCELEIEDCVVVLDWHPCEKCYPESDWIALNRLLDNPDLVEIYD